MTDELIWNEVNLIQVRCFIVGIKPELKYMHALIAKKTTVFSEHLK